MATAFKCDGCGGLFEGRPAVATLSAGSVGTDAAGDAPNGTAPVVASQREVHSIECAIYLLGRLTGDGALARQRLEDALALGQVQAPAPAA